MLGTCVPLQQVYFLCAACVKGKARVSVWVFGGLGQQAASALVFGNPGCIIWGAIVLRYHKCRGCACPVKCQHCSHSCSLGLIFFLCKMHQHNRCEDAITVVIQRAYKLFHIQTRPFLPPAYIRYQGKRTIAHIHDRHARPRRPSRLREICVDALAGRRGEERYAIFAENA